MAKTTDTKRQGEIAAIIGDLERQKSELISNKQANKINKRFKEVEDAAKIPETFMLPNGTAVFTPKKIVQSKYDEIVFRDSDESIDNWFPSSEFIKVWKDKGDFILVLKRVKPNPALADCVPILFKAIVNARTQRFRMIELVAKQHGKEKILNLQAELIRSALGDKVSKKSKERQDDHRQVSGCISWNAVIPELFAAILVLSVKRRNEQTTADRTHKCSPRCNRKMFGRTISKSETDR